MINKLAPIKILLNAFLFSFSIQLIAQDPPDISLVFYLEERSENGTLVGTVTATDPDGDPLTFSIISGNDLGAFAIGSNTGDLTVADENQLDFTVNPEFVLQVEANDGNGGMTRVEITINLIDIPLGLGDADRKLLLYPNPVSGVLYVDMKNISIRAAEVALYSIDGSRAAVLLTKTAGSKIEIDFRQINAGLYILEFSGENLLHRTRIIVK